MLQPRQYAILEDIEHIQRERRKNWPNPDGPISEEAETRHLARIQELKDELAKYAQ